MMRFNGIFRFFRFVCVFFLFSFGFVWLSVCTNHYVSLAVIRLAFNMHSIGMCIIKAQTTRTRIVEICGENWQSLW